jgi:glycosyltransferase involved in cell wall biosynthesis
MKIAVVSSGLGHVARGIETWADDLGAALYKRGVNITLFKGGGKADHPYERVLRCARRDTALARQLPVLVPKPLWHVGFGSAYNIEQTTFAWALIPQVRRGRYDIVHTQDQAVAWWMRKTRWLHGAKVILAHGTEEPLEFLKQFEHVQELAPYYLQEDQRHGVSGNGWYAIPNFVDTERFSPNVDPLSREELGIPKNAFFILTVSAIKRFHKRVDFVIEEVARLRAWHLDRSIHLVVAGAREPETDGIIALGKQRLGSCVTFLENFDRARMPGLFRAADVLLHGSLNEMMPIALLEATASGLPVVAHRWPVIEWIVGEGGTCVDAQKPGALAAAVEQYFDPEFRRHRSAEARKRAVSIFSEEVVVEQMLEMYRQVLNT